MSSFKLIPSKIETPFAFGHQPKDHEGQDRRNNITVGVLGFGNVVDVFFMPVWLNRGTALHVYTSNSRAAVERAHKAGCSAAQPVMSVEEMPRDVDVVFNLTPPHLHLDLIRRVSAMGIPSAVEKPIVCSSPEIDELALFAATAKVPLISIDWILPHGQPLLIAAGVKVPYPDAVEGQGSFRAFDWKNIVKIDARSVEGGGNALGNDIDKIKNRKGMGDYTKGGGVLADMLVHQLTLLARAGITTNKIGAVFLGDPTSEAGVYDRFGREPAPNNRGELYGRAYILMGIEGGNQNIRAVVECGKFGAKNTQFIKLEDGAGNVLHWQTVPNDNAGKVISAGGSWLELRNKEGELLGSARQGADCYALAVDEAINIARNFRNGGPALVPYLPCQVNPTYTLDALHRVARSVSIPEGTKVRQLVIEESARSDGWENCIPVNQLSSDIEKVA